MLLFEICFSNGLFNFRCKTSMFIKAKNWQSRNVNTEGINWNFFSCNDQFKSYINPCMRPIFNVCTQYQHCVIAIWHMKFWHVWVQKYGQWITFLRCVTRRTVFRIFRVSFLEWKYLDIVLYEKSNANTILKETLDFCKHQKNEWSKLMNLWY